MMVSKRWTFFIACDATWKQRHNLSRRVIRRFDRAIMTEAEALLTIKTQLAPIHTGLVRGLKPA